MISCSLGLRIMIAEKESYSKNDNNSLPVFHLEKMKKKKRSPMWERIDKIKGNTKNGF